jgi:hypothetical protein
VTKRGWSRAGGSGALRDWGAAARAVKPAGVTIDLELGQLSGQVRRIPEEHLIKDLAPDGSNQPLDERIFE